MTKRRRPRKNEIMRDDQGFPYPEEDTRHVSAEVLGIYLNYNRNKIWQMTIAKKLPEAGIVRSGRTYAYIPAVIYRIMGWGRYVHAPSSSPLSRVV